MVAKGALGSYELMFSLLNADEHVIFSEWSEEIEWGWQLDDQGEPHFGKIFRDLQKEWGRCESSVYIDQKDGPPKRVGWVFRSRQKFEGSDETYIREAWVTVRRVVEEATPTVYERVAVGASHV